MRGERVPCSSSDRRFRIVKWSLVGEGSWENLWVFRRRFTEESHEKGFWYWLHLQSLREMSVPRLCGRPALQAFTYISHLSKIYSIVWMSQYLPPCRVVIHQPYLEWRIIGMVMGAGYHFDRGDLAYLVAWAKPLSTKILAYGLPRTIMWTLQKSYHDGCRWVLAFGKFFPALRCFVAVWDSRNK